MCCTRQKHGDMVLRCNRKNTVSVHAAMLSMLREREKKSGVKPDPDLDAFMKAQATGGKNGSVNSELILRLLGLQVWTLALSCCAALHCVENSNPHKLTPSHIQPWCAPREPRGGGGGQKAHKCCTTFVIEQLQTLQCIAGMQGYPGGGWHHQGGQWGSKKEGHHRYWSSSLPAPSPSPLL